MSRWLFMLICCRGVGGGTQGNNKLLLVNVTSSNSLKPGLRTLLNLNFRKYLKFLFYCRYISESNCGKTPLEHPPNVPLQN